MPGIDLHIVTFAVPYPPNYGGAMDVWNRLKALKSLGVRIQLHCFLYGPYLPQNILQEVAEEIYYYPRSVWPIFFAKGQPFVISSRKNNQLLNRLQGDQIPVFFEGMQTTAWADSISNKKRMLRAHNVEHKYYQQLARNSGGYRSLIFNRESQCLEEYEKRYAKQFDAVFSISADDHEWFSAQGANSVHLPPFHGFQQVEIDFGRGQYLLYQGDLSIEINQRAVLELIRMLPAAFSMPLVVAGRSGDQGFESKISSFPNIRREADVSQDAMLHLIRHAQVLLVHSLHEEGMKMKLFPALFRGRFVAANQLSATKSALDDAIQFYNAENFTSILTRLASTSFDESALKERQRILSQLPDDATNARQIIRYL